MANVAGADLAIAVSNAGGFGFLSIGYDVTKLAGELDKVVKAQSTNPSLKIGVGIITFTIKSSEQFFAILKDYEATQLVEAIWLFGGDEERWIRMIKDFDPNIKIIVQVWTVAAAEQMVAEGAHVLVAQGSDAGGHKGASAASIVSLVPEIVQATPHIPILAAGGLTNGASILASMVLGAAGVVFGTRFMLTPESMLPQAAKEMALRTKDGGITTLNTRVYDDMRGTTDWPMTYVGRAISNKTADEQVDGRDIEAMKQDYATAVKVGDYSRLVCWSGTGIGLINTLVPAGQIVANLVKEYEQAASQVITRLAL